MPRPVTAAFLGMSLDGFIAGLLDELTVSVLPVVIGKGIRLLEDTGPERWLDLASSRAFSGGMVQLSYLARRTR